MIPALICLFRQLIDNIYFRDATCACRLFRLRHITEALRLPRHGVVEVTLLMLIMRHAASAAAIVDACMPCRLFRRCHSAALLMLRWRYTTLRARRQRL